ncbi:hypothetical protein BRO54_0203 [Geobacillus proteiniphilus]|uniref:Extracellular protein n=1 Tax=Geobacillus proteiniphilus TaxID=860353 RepID=A0A1Q5TAF6_9BACL|nr:hypothetical protein BRO54_0203 [Geobacillus proteiniphilus]
MILMEGEGDVKSFRFFFYIAMIVILNLIPLKAFAYSYGNPNEEAVAEAYKQMKEKLNEQPPNFASAKEIFETVKKEIDMHMGPEPSKAVLAAIEDKDRQAVVENMEKILVLNIARRLENIEKNFDQYDTSKRLLAKAFATYEALSPVIQGKDPSLDKQLRTEFDKALQSLGNPGLFGVGEKKSDINVFKKSKETILTTLQKQFGLKSVKIGHFSESATEKPDAVQKKEWTDLSKAKNWIPLIVIAVVILGAALIYVRRRKRA